MTGHSYATSARTAERMGPFAGYDENEEHMLRVLRQHQEAAAQIDEELVPADAAQRRPAVPGTRPTSSPPTAGVRNSQASVLAPTGTIGLMMDCDTTGIEPDLGLCKVKKLVGGGTMPIVNQTVPRALARLGYTPEQIGRDHRLHRREQVDPRRPAPGRRARRRCSPARWATTPSTTPATCG